MIELKNEIVTSVKKTLCSTIDKSMVKSLGVSDVQNVFPSINAIWVLTGWWRNKCFFGGIMSSSKVLWDSISVCTDFPTTSDNTCNEWRA